MIKNGRSIIRVGDQLHYINSLYLGQVKAQELGIYFPFTFLILFFNLNHQGLVIKSATRTKLKNNQINY